MDNAWMPGGERLSVDEGLSAEQVDRMRERFGRNMLTPPARDPWWKLLLEKFRDPTIRILLVAAAISVTMTAVERYLLGNPHAGFVDSIGILLAVLLATLVGYFSERRSAREFELLSRVRDDVAVRVVRDGQVTNVPIGDLVVGDVVRLAMGDRVPADGVLVEQCGLLLDEAMLTGESVPAEKMAFGEIEPPAAAAVLATEDASADGEPVSSLFDASVPDCARVFRGTMVSDGRGVFVVTRVGDATAMGAIAANLGSDARTGETPLTHKLTVLARQISVAGVSGAMLIFAVMSLRAMWNCPVDAEECFAWTPAFMRSAFPDAMEWVPLLGALIVGYFGMRWLLGPLFRGMGVPLTTRRRQLAAMVPTTVAAYVLIMVAAAIVTGLHDGATERVREATILLDAVLLAIVVAVTVVVVAVPEGLPMMVTVSLALNMMKMAKQNCLVRRLIASETIGSATVICTDKTGTLTRNEMTAVWFRMGEQELEVGDRERLSTLPEWPALAENIAVNTEAHLRITEDVAGRRSLEGIGNPTECALLRLCDALGVDYRVRRHASTRLWELAHNSQRKMSVVVARGADGETVCYAKGAPEVILRGCDRILMNGRPEPIGPQRAAIDAAMERAARRAMRVLAFSECRSPDAARCGGECGGECGESHSAERCVECGERVFIGMIGIADPIRDEVPAAVARCRDAGISVRMITGDSRPTAVAIARQAGILPPDENDGNSNTGSEPDPTGVVLTGEEFAAVPDERLAEVADRLRVLARSTPSDKLRLVRALHRCGEVVAMTGDGTNDAPALMAADVGLSMGVSGTEVAKEASDIVLVDDNFRSIVTGVWWGRTLYHNIQRFLQFQLSVNVVALICALIGPLVGIPLPLTVTQLLWINIIMDTFAAMALSTEPPRPHTLSEPPVPRDANIITPGMGFGVLVCSIYQAAVLFAAIFLGWFTDRDYTPGLSARDPKNLEALTIFFTIFIMFQFWHKLNCRALRADESPFSLLWKNRLFVGIIGTITVVQVVMVECSGSGYGAIGRWIGDIFRTTSITLEQWIGITLLTATIIPVSWLARQATRSPLFAPPGRHTEA